METLAPRASYDRDELGITARMPLVMGVLYGGGMGIWVFFGDLGRYSLSRALINGILAALIGGFIFGTFFPKTMRWLARRANDRIYAGDPRLVPAPPAGRYAYRLPCGWLRTPLRAVSGVLYIGADGLRFDPLLKNPRRLRDGWTMASLDGVSIERRDVPLPKWFRLWGARTAPRIDIVRGPERIQLTIPETDATLARLRDRIQELRGH